MEKTDKNPAPVETVLERPPLFVIMWFREGEPTGLDGVWFFNGTEKIVVKEATPLRNPTFCAGYRQAGPPRGPSYTGPIDDEMMANILIYGG
jgi:hypothetical protein